jgi:hypothetical protein
MRRYRRLFAVLDLLSVLMFMMRSHDDQSASATQTAPPGSTAEAAYDRCDCVVATGAVGRKPVVDPSGCGGCCSPVVPSSHG